MINEHTSTIGRIRLDSRNFWKSEKVRARVQLPNGYGLAVVHKGARFKHNDDPSSPIRLASNINAASTLFALGQLAFAIATLYRSRGEQIEKYGYAAFGLTVIQYAVVSFINFVGNLICPQYPALYTVESKETAEALEFPDTVFEGCIGEPIEEVKQE